MKHNATTIPYMHAREMFPLRNTQCDKNGEVFLSEIERRASRQVGKRLLQRLSGSGELVGGSRT